MEFRNKKLSFNNYKPAFTMAEAILVMTILGIIATIMISTLRPVEFRDRGFRVLAKKIVGQIDTATMQILFNNAKDTNMTLMYTIGSTVNTTAFGGNDNTINLYKKYMVGTREAVAGTWCKKGTKYTKLKDGSCIGFANKPSAATSTWIPGEKEAHSVTPGAGLIYLDVNDEEEPNVYGKDQYTIPMGIDGIAY